MIAKRKNIQLQGIKFGMLSAVTGCAIFAIFEQARLILIFGFGGKTEIEFTILLFLVGTAFAMIPTMIGSCLLSLILYHETSKNRLTISKAIQIGAALGAVTSLGISFLGAVILNGRGSFSVFLFHAIEATVIALV